MSKTINAYEKDSFEFQALDVLNIENSNFARITDNSSLFALNNRNVVLAERAILLSRKDWHLTAFRAVLSPVLSAFGRFAKSNELSAGTARWLRSDIGMPRSAAAVSNFAT